MVDLARPLGKHLTFQLRSVVFLVVLHALNEVLVRPLSPLTEDLSHLGTSHGVHGVASYSVLSLLVGHVRLPGSEVGEIISSMHSLVEESLHQFLLLGLGVLQILNLFALGGDAVMSLIQFILRPRGVLIKVLLIFLHVHRAHVGVLLHELVLELSEESLVVLFESHLSAVSFLENYFLADNGYVSLLGHHRPSGLT